MALQRLILLLAVWGAVTSAFGQQEGLFRNAPATEVRSAPSMEQAIRSRAVLINEAPLPTPQARAGDRVLFNLFDDASFIVILDKMYARTDDRYTWSGHLAGDAYSNVTVSVNGAVMQGNLFSPTLGSYQIRYVKDRLHQIHEVSADDFGTCGNSATQMLYQAPAPPPVPGSPSPVPTKRGMTSLGDLLVVYTPAARTKLGGKEAIEAIIDMAVVEANDYYVQSIIDFELNLVGTFEVSYSEYGIFDNALFELQSPTDGIIDEVHVARNSAGADFVSMIIDNPQYCGLGFVLPSTSANTAWAGFNAVHYNCMGSGITLAHELGHNMGADHDLADTPDGGIYSYSIGWHFGNSTNPGYNGTYKTIMAYPPGSTVRRFSNPDVVYMGEPTGLENVADNARTLNITAPVVSAWKERPSWISVLPTNGVSVTAQVGGPFAPSLVFRLTNQDSTPANWSAASNQSWATVAPSSGLLAVGASTTVTITFGATANLLESGTYNATITFSDLTNAKISPYVIRLKAIGNFSDTVQYHYPMNTNPSWTLAGQWRFGVPLGAGTNNPDPTSGHTGSNVYGYNLAGDYPDDMPQHALRTPIINCSNLKNVGLVFWRWLGVERSVFDRAKIQVSTNGSTWIDVWANEGVTIAETAWSKQSYDLSPVADGQSTVYVRWVMGTSDGHLTYSGWNIDDVSITGDPLVPITVNDVWVNFTHTGVERGTMGEPYSSVTEGASFVNAGGTVHVAAGANNEALVISDPMTLVAEGGIVSIGVNSR